MAFLPTWPPAFACDPHRMLTRRESRKARDVRRNNPSQDRRSATSSLRCWLDRRSNVRCAFLEQGRSEPEQPGVTTACFARIPAFQRSIRLPVRQVRFAREAERQPAVSLAPDPRARPAHGPAIGFLRAARDPHDWRSPVHPSSSRTSKPPNASSSALEMTRAIFSNRIIVREIQN